MTGRQDDSDSPSVAAFSLAGGRAVLSGLSIGSLELNPAFSGEETSYTASTSNKTNTVTATTDDDEAIIGIFLTNSAKTDAPVSNGSPVTWAVGKNELTIIVTANGGAETVYTVTVTKS